MEYNKKSSQYSDTPVTKTKPGATRAWFRFTSKKMRRIAVGAFAFIFTLSFAASLTQNTFAAVSYSGMTVVQKASVYESALILQQCLVGVVGETSEAVVKTGRVGSSGKQWAVWDKTIINYHQSLQDEDNILSCSEYDGALVKGAINRLKIDPVDFVCSMGGERRDYNNCKEGIGDFIYPSQNGSDQPHKYTDSDLVAYLKKTVGIDLNNPGNEVRYWRSYNIVSNYCASDKSVSKAVWDKEKDNNKYLLKDPQTGEDEYFLAVSKKDEKPRYKGEQQGETTCGTYLGRVNQYYPAYKAYLKNLSPEDQDKETKSQEDNQNPPVEGGASACAVEGIGWIICPITNAMAGMADAMFGVIAGFMKVTPLGFDQDNGLYKAWMVMRNIANVAFVIAFLIIIFAQLTGAGITNYGVKKMLPRLVIAALLVNLSYFICALAVDLSNIIGVGLQEVLVRTANIAVGAQNSTAEQWGSVTASILSMGALGAGAFAGVAIFSSIGIWGALAGLLPLLVSALFAIVIAFIVLVARQAFIVILIVISPLAFVAFLLPNTEDLFKKWRSFFVTLLALFPMMALVFGGSTLASAIIRVGAEEKMKDGDAVGFFVYLGSIAILAIPFFITPVLIKLSSGVLNRFAGMINNRNKGPFDSMRRGAERIGKNAQNRGYLNKLERGGRKKISSFGARRRARIEAISSNLESESKRGATSYVADELQNNERFAATAAGGKNRTEAIFRVTAGAIGTVDKLKADELSAAEVMLKDVNLTQDQNRILAKGGKVTIKDAAGNVTRELDASKSILLQKAGISQAVKTNDVKGINELLDSGAVRGNEELRSTFADALQGSSGRPKYLSQGVIAGLRQEPDATNGSAKTIIENSVKNNTYSPEAIATGDKDELASVAAVMADPNTTISSAEKERIVGNARVALTDDKLKTIIGKNKDSVDVLAEKYGKL